MNQATQYQYEVALSFAGEDRAYVEQVASLLRAQGINVFYDKFEEANLWGKNLYEHLIDIYQKKAKFTVVFISKHYAGKLWSTHERKAAQARAFQESAEYILPVRFDNTDVPGILPTTAYIALKDTPPPDLVGLIVKKLVSSGTTVPSEQIRRDFSQLRATIKTNPVLLEVHVRSTAGQPISGADVMAVAENATGISGKTGADGKVQLSFRTRRKYTLLVGHPDYPAAMQEGIDPADDLSLTIEPTSNMGSIICDSTCYLPGLKGRLNPIFDSHDRMYIYADNIAINGGLGQPVGFQLNVPMEMEDSHGAIFLVTIKFIRGQFSLLQYLKSN